MSPFPDDDNPNKRVIFLSGTVVTNDGTPLPDRAKIERICSNFPLVEGDTDHKGHFSFELGRSLDMPDVSVGTNPTSHRTPIGNGLPGSKIMSNRSMGNSDRRLWGCELRAVLPGFRSDAIQLDTFHYLDDSARGSAHGPWQEEHARALRAGSGLGPESRFHRVGGSHSLLFGSDAGGHGQGLGREATATGPGLSAGRSPEG
jgi:hypothetical protein